MDDSILLSINGISKRFPGTQALDDVSFYIKKGEIHALVGENGAGKSTLVKIISGVIQKDKGSITFNGREMEIKNPHQARKIGINVVYQELSLVPNLTVGENIYASSTDMNSFRLARIDNIDDEARELLDIFNINTRTLVSKLGIAAQQAVEIAGALSRNCRIIILDEPTASLTDSEIKNLFGIINMLRDRGITVLYISHKLEEIFEISDRITVLKDGKYVDTVNTEESTENQIINMMVGRDLDEMFPAKSKENEECVMSVENLSGPKFNDVSFDLFRGEILGFAGLAGAGRTELFRSIFGVDKIISGSILIDGEKVNISNPLDAIKKGLGYLPEDRKQSGLFLEMSVTDNTVAANLNEMSENNFVNLELFEQKTNLMVEKLNIKISSTKDKLYNLSGGNQQKVLLARWLLVKPKILVVDEPTRGIDVGAKQEVYFLLRELANEGIAVVMISSELPEILGMSDRIATMYHGKINGVISKEEATEERVASLIMGIEGHQSESEVSDVK